MTVKVLIDKVAAVRKAVEALAEKELLVGIPSDKNSRSEDLGNAEIARIHEFGSPANNIPSRPFLIPGAREAQKDVFAELKKGATEALSKGAGAIDKSYTRAGMIAQKFIQNKITNGEFAPLSERTLAQRRASGAKGTKPLIRTGQLRRSISFVIKNGKN